MMPGLPVQRRPRGFTLIEILLAVAVFAIVLTAINTVFFGALRLRNKTNEAFETALPLQQAVAIITRDLEGIVMPGGTLFGPMQSTPTNTAGMVDSICTRVSADLFTNTGLVDDSSPWSEIQKVAYFLAAPTNNTAGKDLIRSVTHNLLPVNTDDPVQQWLLSGVDKMAMQYYDGMAWIDTWDTTTATNLPTAIKVQIYFLADNSSRTAPTPVEFIVPVVVQPLTNTVTTTAGGGG